jgi:hypothetical protein
MWPLRAFVMKPFHPKRSTGHYITSVYYQINFDWDYDFDCLWNDIEKLYEYDSMLDLPTNFSRPLDVKISRSLLGKAHIKISTWRPYVRFMLHNRCNDFLFVETLKITLQ